MLAVKSFYSMSPEDLRSLADVLQSHHHGRMQYRLGYKTNVDAFCVVKVETDGLVQLSGHVSGPHGNNARFGVYLADPSKDQVLIHVRPEAPGGYNRERAMQDITKALAVMVKRAKTGGEIRGISTKYWKGYYLRNSGSKSVGKAGLQRFDETIQLGMITPSFKQTCLEFGFTMVKCD